MANRSYLYASNGVKHESGSPEQRNVIGISEWNSDIPLIYKILMSGNPKIIKSSIWVEAGNIAIVGEYSQGVAQLSRFLDKITLPGAQELKNEALEFLSKNHRSHFILECGEIYDMEDDDIEIQNAQLFTEISNLEQQIEQALSDLLPPTLELHKERSWLTRLLGSAQPASPSVVSGDPLDQIYSLGLGNWSNVLYFDLTGV